MAYTARFGSVDLLISQLKPLVQPGIDPLVLSSWAGLVAVKAVTAYELAIKDIFEDFARGKHKVFGTFVKASYKKLNGRITYGDVKDGLVKTYGDKYSKKLVQKKEAKSAAVLVSDRVDLVRTYDNLIECRHQLVHAGAFTLSFDEAVRSYQIGKKLIEVFDETMKR